MTVSPARRAGWFAALTLAAAAVAGGALGYALGRPDAAPREGPDVTLLGLTRGSVLDSLELTDDQRARIESLLDGASRAIRSRVDTMMTDIRTLTVATRGELRAMLDQRQRERFDSLLASAPTMRLRTPAPPGRLPQPADTGNLPRKEAPPPN